MTEDNRERWKMDGSLQVNARPKLYKKYCCESILEMDECVAVEGDVFEVVAGGVGRVKLSQRCWSAPPLP